MRNEIYIIRYKIGGSFEKRVGIVSASSSERAQDLLARHLSSGYIRIEDPDNFGFEVKYVKVIGTRADQERAIFPEPLSVLEMRLAIQATKKILTE